MSVRKASWAAAVILFPTTTSAAAGVPCARRVYSAAIFVLIALKSLADIIAI